MLLPVIPMLAFHFCASNLTGETLTYLKTEKYDLFRTKYAILEKLIGIEVFFRKDTATCINKQIEDKICTIVGLFALD
jgi:hypothetical protein